MLSRTVKHLLENVLPAARDYFAAEQALSEAYQRNPTAFTAEAHLAKRRAAEVAIAIDGLADRAATALTTTPDNVRTQVAPLCAINGVLRDRCIDRICAVANAYKHDGPLRAKHPIVSADDILATGLGYGLDGYGVGKYSGVEVFVSQKDGTSWKMLGDIPWALAGWFAFLARQGVTLPEPAYTICNISLPAR